MKRTALLALVCSSAGLASCAPAMPVRDLVASARFADACAKIRSTPPLEGNPDDMKEYDVLQELAPKAPAKLRIRVLSAFEAEKETGLLAGTSLRLPPLPPGHFPTMVELAKGLPGDTLEQDWLVLEATLEVGASAAASVGLGTIALQERSRASTDASQPWAPRWSAASVWQAWSPSTSQGKSTDQQLAEAFGLSRAAGRTEISVWSLVDLLALGATLGAVDPQTRGSNPLLGTRESPGRTPTPAEKASMEKLAALVQTPACAAVRPGAACTQRLLFKRSMPAVVNTLKVDMSYSFGAGESACSLLDFLEVPLPLAASISAQLASVFERGSVPISDLEKREEVFQRSADACESGRPGCAPVSDCPSSAACGLQSQCHAEGGSCAATAADCESSGACALVGRCQSKGGQCVAPQGASEGCERQCAVAGECEKTGNHCLPGASEQCAASLGCGRFGLCHKDGAFCLPTSSADCASSVACRERGFCSLDKQMCQALTNADCARAEVCTRFGACEAREGMCVTR